MMTIQKRVDYTIEIPDYGTPISIGELIEFVKRSGSHFFDRDTLRFFKSRVDDVTFTAPDGWYFVTSEKHESAFAGINEPRLYTVRCLRAVPADAGGLELRLLELEGFQQYQTLTRARTAARRAARTARPVCTSCHLRVSADDARTVCQECDARAARYAAEAASRATS